LDIFNFNRYKAYGKVDSISFKHWIFFLTWIAITSVVVGFRVGQARKLRQEAMEKNAGLFKKSALVDIDGYVEPDEDPVTTVIAM